MSANDSSPFSLGGDNLSPSDPTRAVPVRAQQLFTKCAQLASGFDYDDVIDCAANLLINVLRQRYPGRRDALEKFSEVLNKTGNLLASHYDPSTGKRRNVFPFTQTINLDHFLDPEK